MGRLIYTAIASVDGYVADADGNFDWAEPDAEVHAFVNELERPVGTALYGRRMYEVLLAWETWDTAGEPDYIRDWAEIWRAADKVVYSRTLGEVSSARTRIEREFDPAAVVAMKRDAERDLAIGGPQLAAEALRAGLVDECHLLLTPVAVGGGTAALPPGVRLDLELLGERRFGSGVVGLHYGLSGHRRKSGHVAGGRIVVPGEDGGGGQCLMARPPPTDAARGDEAPPERDRTCGGGH